MNQYIFSYIFLLLLSFISNMNAVRPLKRLLVSSYRSHMQPKGIALPSQKENKDTDNKQKKQKSAMAKSAPVVIVDLQATSKPLVPQSLSSDQNTTINYHVVLKNSLLVNTPLPYVIVKIVSTYSLRDTYVQSCSNQSIWIKEDTSDGEQETVGINFVYDRPHFEVYHYRRKGEYSEWQRNRCQWPRDSYIYDNLFYFYRAREELTLSQDMRNLIIHAMRHKVSSHHNVFQYSNKCFIFPTSTTLYHIVIDGALLSEKEICSPSGYRFTTLYQIVVESSKTILFACIEKNGEFRTFFRYRLSDLHCLGEVAELRRMIKTI